MKVYDIKYYFDFFSDQNACKIATGHLVISKADREREWCNIWCLHLQCFAQGQLAEQLDSWFNLWVSMMFQIFFEHTQFLNVITVCVLQKSVNVHVSKAVSQQYFVKEPPPP